MTKCSNDTIMIGCVLFTEIGNFIFTFMCRSHMVVSLCQNLHKCQHRIYMRACFQFFLKLSNSIFSEKNPNGVHVHPGSHHPPPPCNGHYISLSFIYKGENDSYSGENGTDYFRATDRIWLAIDTKDDFY
jgi:hypothetical protein